MIPWLSLLLLAPWAYAGTSPCTAPRLVTDAGAGRKLVVCGSDEAELAILLQAADGSSQKVFEATARERIRVARTPDGKRLALTERVSVAGELRDAVIFELECGDAGCWPGERRCELKPDWKPRPAVVAEARAALQGDARASVDWSALIERLKEEALRGNHDAIELLNDRRWNRWVEGPASELLREARRWAKLTSRARCFVAPERK